MKNADTPDGKLIIYLYFWSVNNETLNALIL